jgi:hypothetical protein
MRVIAALAIAASATLAASCGAEADLAKSVEIADVQSGYYETGYVDGKAKIVPSATVRVKNVSDHEIDGFQISASFWIVGDDGMKDEVVIPTLVARGLAAGATSDAITLRANFGYTVEGARNEAFQNSYFRDYTIKVFGKVNGRIAKVGEFTVDRRFLPKDATVPTT